MTALDYQVQGDALDQWIACPHPRCHDTHYWRAWPVTVGMVLEWADHHERQKHSGGAPLQG